MTITITQAHNEARLEGTRAFLDSGTGRARVRLYGGTRPSSVNDAPGTPMLVEIPLQKPCGTVAGGVLTLVQHEDGLIAETGIATWARVVNGNDTVAFDCDVGQGPGAWEIQLGQTQLYAGGLVRLVSFVLG